MRVVRIRVQGKREDVRELKEFIEDALLNKYSCEITWSPEYQDFSKRWSRHPGKPTGKIRVYATVVLR